MKNGQGRKERLPDSGQCFGKIYKYLSVAGFVFCAGISIWGYQRGIFQSSKSLHDFVIGLGKSGVLFFLLLQIVQVVFPILPGGISCLAGVVLFGPLSGFFYNYLGICIGSLLAFGISRALGKPLLFHIFSEQKLKKYEAWETEHQRFLKLFAAAIFFPAAPDDFLCYLAGTTSMTWKQFSLIIFLGKPVSIALYSLGLTTVFRMFFPEW